MAEQCFYNEYIFKSTKKEEKLLLKVEKELCNKKKIDEYDLLLISLYKPIKTLKFLNNKLDTYQSESKDFNNYLTFTFKNSQYENLLANKIKNLSSLLTKNLC